MAMEDHPLRRLYTPKAGPFRRGIRLCRLDDRSCYGWVDDDFHNFGVRITYLEGLITEVTVQTRRAPWTSCAAASIPLQALTGQPLHPRASDIGRLVDMRLQCTHMFDLAGLVMAHACRSEPERSYLVTVPMRPTSFDEPRIRQVGRTHATLTQNGQQSMSWELEDEDIVGPAAYAGHSLNQGFRAWTETLPVEEAEQAFVLRRAIMVSTGRGIDMDLVDDASQAPLPPVCHTFRGPLQDAKRIHHSIRDYGLTPEALLQGAHDIP